VDSSESKIVSDKHQSRALVQQECDRAAVRESKLRAQIIELEQRTFDLTEATKTAQKEKGIYCRRFLISKRLAAKRLALSIDLKQEKQQLTEEVLDLEKQNAAQDAVIKKYIQQQKQTKEKVLKKYRKSGTRGGAHVWEDWVVLLVVELLVLGVPPKAVPGSITTVYTTLYGNPQMRCLLFLLFAGAEKWSRLSARL